MATATLGDWSFALDPSSVSWTFAAKTSSTVTLGGRVVQVLGVDYGDMTISGSFGSGGRVEQQRFFEWAKQASRAQAAAQGNGLRFRFPARQWDFEVQIKSLTDLNARRSVRLNQTNFNPQFNMTFHVIRDLSEITSSAIVNYYIGNLASGVGWKLTAYNGPLTGADIQQRIDNAGGIEPYLGGDVDPWSGVPNEQPEE